MADLATLLAKSQGGVARWANVIAVSIAGVSSFSCYYLVEFNICQNFDCERLVVTRYYASSTWWYLVLGLALLGVGHFLRRAKDLARGYAIAITIASLTGFVLSGMAVFAMLKEVKLLG